MKVIMTQYFYPIKRGGTEKFFDGIYFDNPRTEEELDYVSSYLKMINEIKMNCFRDDLFEEPVKEETIREGIKEFYMNHKEDILVRDYYSKIKNIENVYMALAKMWVIIRCDKLIDNVAKNKTFYFGNVKNEQLESVSTINTYNVDKIDKYLKLLSFMTINEESPFKSIIINKSYNFSFVPPFFFFYKLFTITRIKDFDNINFLDCCFPDLWRKFKYYIDLVNTKFTDEKFLYICDVISHLCTLRKNVKMYLLSVVGLIELFIIHNPHSLDDSISKQFVKKMKYILYKDDPSIDLIKLEKVLKWAYSIRSNIAHGNFGKENDKILIKLSNYYELNPNDENEFFYHIIEDSIEFLNDDLTLYLKKILKLYLQSEEELSSIKEL